MLTANECRKLAREALIGEPLRLLERQRLEIAENKSEACEMRLTAAHETGTLTASRLRVSISLRFSYAWRWRTRYNVMLAWLADYGFRLLTAPSGTYLQNHRPIALPAGRRVCSADRQVRAQVGS